MMNSARFSIAMCTYNGEKYLQEQLDSIAAQTVLPAELVICDDGSADETLRIAREFSEHSQFPIHIHVNEINLGVAANFFKAIHLCSEKWILLCDQDDVWLKDRIEYFSNLLTLLPQCHLIVSNGYIVDERTSPTGQDLFHSFHLTKKEQRMVNHGLASIVLARHVFATGAGMVVRRKWAIQLPMPDHDFLHDEWLAWFAGSTMRVSDKPTFLYRQHANQVTGIDGSIKGQIRRLRNPESKASRTLEQSVFRMNILRKAYLETGMNSANDIIIAIDRKIEFDQRRQSIPASGVKRLIHIFFIIGPLQYSRYAKGWRTIVKDLINRGQNVRE